MGWSGGTYTKGNNATGGWAGDASLGIGIEAGRHDTQDDDFTAGINNCIAKDGQNTPTANLPMGGYKHTGVANASSNDEYTTQGQLSDGSFLLDVEKVTISQTTPGTLINAQYATGTSGRIVDIKDDSSNPVFTVRESGFTGINTATQTIAGARLEVQNAGATGDCRIATASTIGNNEVSGFQANGTTGAALRRALIGVYKHSGITNPSGYMFLESEGGLDVYFWTDNSGIFRLSTTNTNVGTTGGVVVGTQTSDERLKDIADTFPYGLKEIKKLVPIQFTRNDVPDQKTRLGFGAQTTEKVVPEAVYDTNEQIEGESPEDTMLAMDYTTLIPVLVKAIQELESKVASLEAQLA